MNEVGFSSLTKIFVCLLFLFLQLACDREQKYPSQIESVGSQSEASLSWICREGFIRSGETLQKLLSRETNNRLEANQAIAAFSSVFDVRSLKAGNKYRLCTDSSGTIQRFIYYLDKEREVRVYRDSLGTLQAQIYSKPVRVMINSLRGIVYSTLYEAIIHCGHSDALIVAFSDVFQWDIDFFTDPRVGDEFVIVFESIYLEDPHRPDSLGEWVGYGRVLAGQYRSQNKDYTAIYFKGTDKEGGYYDLEGRSFQKTFLKSPLNYRRISSFFSAGRLHPILKTVRAHTGVDFAAPTGTPVSATADGTIIDKGYDASIGNYIKIRHKNPHFITLYGHLDAFAKGLEKGAVVKQRDIIGYVGSTGLATGPHLHYAFYENGQPLNPLRIKNSAGDPIAVVYREAFERTKEDMQRRLAMAIRANREIIHRLTYRDRYGIGVSGLPQP